jgi:hypothetical protein
MAEPDTNTSGVSTTARARDAGNGSERTQQSTQQASGGDGLRVDGRVVTEEEWLKAASENGYDLERLPPNYRPAINTKR